MIRDYYDIGIIFVAISLVLLAGREWEVRLNQKSLAKHRCNKSLIFFLNQHECNTFSSLVSGYRSHLIQMHKATSSVCVRRAKPSLQQRPAPVSSRLTTLLLVNFRQKTYFQGTQTQLSWAKAACATQPRPRPLLGLGQGLYFTIQELQRGELLAVE